MNNTREKFRKRRAALWCITVGELDTITLTISESLEYNWRNKIGLFVYDKKWSYCLHVWPGGDVAGQFYGPHFSFCDPYPERQTALESAVNKMLAVYGESNRHGTKHLADWAKSLILPTQMSLL